MKAVLDLPSSAAQIPKYDRRRRPKRRKNPNYLIPKLIVCVLLTLGMWQLFVHPMWILQPQSIQIDGLTRYNSRFVIRFLHNSNLVGQHVLQVNPLNLRQEILGYPLLADVQIERHLWPTRLSIHLFERQPLFRIYIEPSEGISYEDKNSFVVDNQGVILPLPYDRKPQESIQVSISPPIKTLSPDILDTIVKLNQYNTNRKIPYQGVFNISHLDNIVFIAPDLPVPVWLGTMDDFGMKMALLEPTKNLVTKYQSQVQYIDLRFWKHPVLKMR